jgi:hypothetical protein
MKDAPRNLVSKSIGMIQRRVARCHIETGLGRERAELLRKVNIKLWDALADLEFDETLKFHEDEARPEMRRNASGQFVSREQIAA